MTKGPLNEKTNSTEQSKALRYLKNIKLHSRQSKANDKPMQNSCSFLAIKSQISAKKPTYTLVRA